MAYDKTKFTEALLYAAWKLRDDEAGGAVKLNKVLYFAEFGHMREHGRPISGARFFKLKEGPAPRALLPVRTELIERGDASLDRRPFVGQVQDRLIPKAAPELGSLTADERRSIDQALILLEGMSAAQCSEFSHREPGWRLVDWEEDIPYESAFLATDQDVTPAIRSRVAELANKLGLTG